MKERQLSNEKIIDKHTVKKVSKKPRIDQFFTKRRFHNGAIKRIYIKDFMTYREIELFPGPNLNVVVGPNGTGKSSLLCAICIGLGGDTTSIGRAKSVDEFIRHHQNRAIIEINLSDNDNGTDVIVRLEILRGKSPQWIINGVRRNKNEAKEIFKNLNISMNNLCQFQSQEKVQDFAKMSSQQLLKSTQICTGDFSLEADLTYLISSQTELRTFDTSLKNGNATLQSLKADIERIGKEASAYRMYKQIEEDIDVLEKKKEIVEYKDAKKKATSLKQQLDEKRKEVESMECRLAPLRQNISAAKNKFQQMQREVVTQEANITEKSRILSRKRQEMADLNEKIKDEKCICETSAEENEKIRVEIATLKNLIQRDRNQLRLAENSGVDFQPEIEEVKRKINSLQKIINDSGSKRDHLTGMISQLKRGMQVKLKESAELRNVETIKMEKLRHINSQAHDAVGFLEQMQRDNCFVKPVYRPLALTISVSDHRFAKYLERAISFNDMYAFGFEDKKDMNRFLAEVNGKRKMNIGAYHCPAGLAVQEDPEYRAPVSIDVLRGYGFEEYLSDAVRLNNSQFRYICKMSRIHKIPVGSESVSNYLEQFRSRFGDKIAHFYAGSVGYMVKKSRFSGDFITSSWNVSEARILDTGLDQHKLIAVETEVSRYQGKIAEFDSLVQAENKKTREAVIKLEEQRSKLVSLTKKQNEHKYFEISIQKNQKKIQEKEGAIKNLDDVKKEMQMKCKGLVTQILSIQEAICKGMGSRQSDFRSLILKLALKEHLKKELQESERQFKDQSSCLMTLKDEISHIDREFSSVKSVATLKYQILLQKQVLQRDGNISRTISSKFALLPDSLEELDRRLDNEKARLVCMAGNKGSLNAVKDYDSKQEQLKQLEKDILDKTAGLQELEVKIKRTRDRYILRVESLITKLSQNFGKLLATLGCAGEVIFDKGDGEHDYSKYGLKIRVKYRDSEELRDFSFQSQSGGEKSVATAIYMMAMQELTTVPFRCVDEINQGMDEANERKVFELLVNTSCEEGSAQYFLLTPKLLIGLPFSKGVKIHDINNGFGSVHYTQWDFAKFKNVLKL
ncbi:structural maintenance of chromosomes protein 5-like [Artemia franciscana]|uniref:structural maintenance of chromosomes protein 5-like n=1 Tax=Artemia franciscana TaxID=6661 RepID=UPI0032DB77A9